MFHSGSTASHKQTVTTAVAGAGATGHLSAQPLLSREQIVAAGAQAAHSTRPYSAPVFGSDAAALARPPDHIVGLAPGALNLGPGPGSVTGGVPGYTSQGSTKGGTAGLPSFSFSPPGLQTLGRVSSLSQIWEDYEMTQPAWR